MGAMLDSDILYSIIAEVADSPSHTQDLKNISLATRLLREVALPVLFHDVRWPHGDKHSEENGLEFFPESLWRHFRKLSLLWPDHWPDSTPPLWGDRYYIGGDYHPRHMDKLIHALPRMEGLNKLRISCPFYPPSAIFTALTQCPSIRSLSISDTPVYMGLIPRVPSQFHLEHISLVPVAEALRVGEGPYDAKYQDLTYYIRDYRKKYKHDSLAWYAAQALLFNFAKAHALRSIQVSGDLCQLFDLAQHEWPNLHTLILTGHAPRQSGTELVDVVAKMPKLEDLRLLFATVKNDPLFQVLPSQLSTPNPLIPSITHPVHTTAKGNPATLLTQLRRFALSNACQLSGVIFHYANQLERLVICAISDLPRVPIALSRAEVNALMNDLSTPLTNQGVSIGDTSLSSSTSLQPSPTPSSAIAAASSPVALNYPSLKVLRIMIEDKANPDLCHRITSLFPSLESLEVELCGYHDGKSIYAWEEFASALGPLSDSLRTLRLCIQFPEFDEADRVEPWRNARRECAAYFAGRMGKLERVGFEYRKRTGTHRYEDSWLEFEVVRSGGPSSRRNSMLLQGVGGGALLHPGGYHVMEYQHHPVQLHHTHNHPGLTSTYNNPNVPQGTAAHASGGRVVNLLQLPPSWYRFPEVWSPEYITP